MPANPLPRWLLAVCYRSGYISLAVFADGELVEARTTRLRDQRTKHTAIESLVQKFVFDYAVDSVVVEPGTILDAVVQKLDLPMIFLNLKEAKRLLLQEGEQLTHDALYKFLIREGASYRRLVNINPKNGKPITQQWRLISLLPVALGLAVINSMHVQHSFISNHNSYASPSLSLPRRIYQS